MLNSRKKNFDNKLKVIINNKNLGFGGTHKIIFDNTLKKNSGYVLVLHGDDQADINDIMPFIKNKIYTKMRLFRS